MVLRLAFAGLWTLLVLFCICTDVVICERHGLPAKYITVRREKRSGPVVVDVEDSHDEREGDFPFDHQTFNAETSRIKRDVFRDTVSTPEVNVVSSCKAFTWVVISSFAVLTSTVGTELFQVVVSQVNKSKAVMHPA